MKNKHFILIFSLLFAASVLVIAIINHMKPTDMTAEIISDGEVIERIDLSRVEESKNITVKSKDGGYNTVHIESGSVSVIDSDCPDLLCVKQGAIKNGVYPIICLPHKLVVKIVTDSDDADIDAIVGK